MTRKRNNQDPERSESRKDRATRCEIDALRCICHELRKLNEFLRAAKFLKISQRNGANMNDSVKGVQAGATGVFDVSEFPVGSQLQAGNIPQWSVDDTTDVSLTPSADGTSVAAAVSGTATAPSFNLTVTAISLDGTALTDTVSVPILPVTPPPVPATGLTITQVS